MEVKEKQMLIYACLSLCVRSR